MFLAKNKLKELHSFNWINRLCDWGTITSMYIIMEVWGT